MEEFNRIIEIDPIIKPKSKEKVNETYKNKMIVNIIESINNLEKTLKKIRIN